MTITTSHELWWFWVLKVCGDYNALDPLRHFLPVGSSKHFMSKQMPGWLTESGHR